jgi:hypothetical protein
MPRKKLAARVLRTASRHLYALFGEMLLTAKR